LSDEVYDKLYYVPFTRIANLSPEVERITLTVGSAGKNFYATGWRVGRFERKRYALSEIIGSDSLTYVR
jgi:aspartate/methionine/tyrosine aminotransferase